MYYDILNPVTHSGFRKSLLLLPLVTALTSCGIADSSGEGVNPGINDLPIAYVKRTIPLDDDGFQVQPDLRDPLLSMPGGDLYLRASTSGDATEINITGSVTNGRGDVKDLDVSNDGKKLIFSLQPEDLTPNDNITPRWEIYTYDIDSETLTQVVTNASSADGDDLDPFFLADGRIVFSSNRQTQSREALTNENLVVFKSPFASNAEDNGIQALVLHVMNEDGSGIKQISFNQSHDLDPTLLKDGRILFTRWDRINNKNAMSLYTVYPDGTGLQLYYGAHNVSHQDAASNTVQMMTPRELPDGRIMMMSQPFTDTFGGGQIVIVDGKNYVDINQPTAINQNILNGPAQTTATGVNVILDGSRSLAGNFASFYPLNDGKRMLVSKGLCQVGVDLNTDPNVMTADLEINLCLEPHLSAPGAFTAYPSYGVWVYDRSDFTESLITSAETGMMISEVVALKPYDRPDISPVKPIDTDLRNENVGMLKIRSVYDFAGAYDGCFFGLCTESTATTNPLNLGDPMIATADQRKARFIRIVKAVGLPDRNDPELTDPPNLSNEAFGRNRRLGMKEIIGYNEIQPDGSVMVKVPANIAFYFDILDKDARRIGPRHDNWLSVNPGDTLECSGCHSHTPARPLPHGRDDAEPASSNAGAPADNFSFPNTLDPFTMLPYTADYQQTMAEALAHAQERNNVFTSVTLSLDVNYTDVWTDPNARAIDTQFSYVYSDRTLLPSTIFTEGLTTLKPFPLNTPCEATWAANCRIVINYGEHIHPIWKAPRPSGTCTSCHSFTSGVSIVPPAAQLDLGRIDDIQLPEFDPIVGDQLVAYRELLFNDNFQFVNGNILDDVLITVPALDDNGDPILDANGNPTFEDIPDPALALSPTMSTAGARSSYFIEKMNETELNAGRNLTSPATVNHANMLTPAELRLISEWLDIGAQYYNNPFHPMVPEN